MIDRSFKRRLARMKPWAVIDPYVVSPTEWYVRSFDDEQAAEAWLAKKLKEDDGGYAGCYVMERQEALQIYAPNV